MSPSAKTTRLRALIRKEARQMLREHGNLSIGLLLPVLLLLIFGYALSLDVRDVSVAVTQEAGVPETRDLFLSLDFSNYFSPRMTHSMHDAEELLQSGKVEAIAHPQRDPENSGALIIQLVVNGRDANRARIILQYLEGACAEWAAKLTAEHTGTGADPAGGLRVDTRIWFNHAQESSYFLVPGVTVLIMTLIGALLTGLVMAREWEQGSFEALFITPASSLEILLGKIVPYFCLGMAGLALCLAMSRFVFDVPMRGSLTLIVLGSALYLFVALGMGLVISTFAKSQFLASQMILVFSFVPTIMLSGFIFDLRGAPGIVYYIAHCLPATWYVKLLQTLFLAGNVPEIVIHCFAVLAFFAALFLALARAATRKSLA